MNLYNADFHSILQNLSSTSGKPISEILEKGGVFWDKNKEYKDGPAGTLGTHMAGQYGKIIRLFADPLARTRDSITGEYYLGTPERTLQTFHDGTPVDQVDAAWPYQLIRTARRPRTGSCAVNSWLCCATTRTPSTSDHRRSLRHRGRRPSALRPATSRADRQSKSDRGMPGVLGEPPLRPLELSSKPFRQRRRRRWTRRDR
jgi:hypothetical protein